MVTEKGENMNKGKGGIVEEENGISGEKWGLGQQGQSLSNSADCQLYFCITLLSFPFHFQYLLFYGMNSIFL